MVANNSGGEKTPAYGKTENFVRQIKMVIRDGTECVFEPLSMQKLEKKKNLNNAEGDIYRRMFSLIDENYEAIKSAKPNVSKNSAGYYLWNVYDRDKGVFDLTRLITGSQGTLGVITEATLGLVKPKPYSRLLVIFLKEIKDVAKIANIVLRFKPECFESYDDNTFKVAMKFLPDLAKQMKTGLLKIAWQFLPEFFMGITGGAPKLVLIAQFAGDTPQECDGAARTAQKSFSTNSISKPKLRRAKRRRKNTGPCGGRASIFYANTCADSERRRLSTTSLFCQNIFQNFFRVSTRYSTPLTYSSLSPGMLETEIFI